MNGRVAAAVVVALFAITGCTTGQPSGGGAASPSLAVASLAPTATTSTHRSELQAIVDSIKIEP